MQEHKYSNSESEELKHYGILGMRWGVRRTPDQLRRASAKLDRKNEKLQNKYIKTTDKATRMRNKAYSPLATKSRSEKRLFEANKLEAKGKRYEALMLKNEQKKSVFDNTLSAIEKGKVLEGNKFVMKYEKETVKKYLA